MFFVHGSGVSPKNGLRQYQAAIKPFFDPTTLIPGNPDFFDEIRPFMNFAPRPFDASEKGAEKGACGPPPKASPFVGIPNVLPHEIRNETELDDLLTRPRPELVDFIRSVASPLLILGAGGKMGPTLAVLAKRAAELARHKLDIIAVSRFSDDSARQWLESHGIETLNADLLKPKAVRKLPDARDVIYLVGLKFGTRQNPALTWAANTIAPSHVAERYTDSRLVALSTGNVYPMVPVSSGGSREKDSLTPLGEYANAAVARERIFEYVARQSNSAIAILRLNYAVELRYGVLADIARSVYAGEPVDVTSGYFNCIWQGDANEIILRALDLTGRPPTAFNLTSPSIVSVRHVATKFSELLERPAKFIGTEANMALLSNTELLCAKLGPPATALDTVIRWTAHWVKNGGRSLNKPTHFEVRDGSY